MYVCVCVYIIVCVCCCVLCLSCCVVVCLLLCCCVSLCLCLSVALPAYLARPCAWLSLCTVCVSTCDCVTWFAHSLSYYSTTGQYIVCVYCMYYYTLCMYTCTIGVLCFWDIACAVCCLLLSRVFSCSTIVWQTRWPRPATAPVAYLVCMCCMCMFFL